MFKYGEPFEPIMNKLLVILITAIIMIGLIGTTMTVPQASYATKQSKQVPPEKTTVTPKTISTAIRSTGVTKTNAIWLWTL